MMRVVSYNKFLTLLFVIVGVGLVFVYTTAHAAPLTSPNYRLDAQVMNNFGGQSTSGSYALLGSGGEAIVGNGAGGSYKLGVGYVPQTDRSLELSLDSDIVSIPEVVPGQSQSETLEATVRTDFGGYDLSIMQSSNLTYIGDPGTTISNINNGGTIATPALWSEGGTKGLGFGVVSGFNVDPKWGTAPLSVKYAALPPTATPFYGKSGLSGGVEESTEIAFRLDVPSSQKSGPYSSTVTIIATARP
jgi:hypothetical protein